MAVDGHITEDVANQLKKLPPDATHLVVSAGGNDALGEINLLAEQVVSVGEALGLVELTRERFRQSYRAMLSALSQFAKLTAVCTVYDSIPGLEPELKVALAGFNEIILREAVSAGLPVVDLRLICNLTSDYSHVSSIEPSMTGGAKIARVIADVVTTHDFARGRSTIYV